MFAKIFKGIYYGSMKATNETMRMAREVFVCLCAHADRDGVVEYMNEEMLAALVGYDVDQIRAAVAVLEAPDAESRTPDEDGRRLIRLEPCGWRIVTYEKYRGIRDEDDRRRQNREAQERKRVRERQPEISLTSAVGQPSSAQAEADGEVEVEVKRASSTPAASALNGSGEKIEFEFQTVGRGPKTYAVTRESLIEWAMDYPAVDVYQEMGKIRAWIRANPRRRKTAEGMPRMIVTWFSREQDKGRTAIPTLQVVKTLTGEERRKVEAEIREKRAVALEKASAENPIEMDPEDRKRFVAALEVFKRTSGGGGREGRT